MPRTLSDDSGSRPSRLSRSSAATNRAEPKCEPSGAGAALGALDAGAPSLDQLPRARAVQDTIVRLIQAVRTRFG